LIDNAELRVEVASTQDSLQAKVAELELKNADLISKDQQLTAKAQELTVSQSTCEALSTQLRELTRQHESTQRGLAEQTREELRKLKEALSTASAGKERLEEENKRLEREKAKLEADYKRALERLEQVLSERRLLLALWGIGDDEKEGVNVVGIIKEGKARLESELQIQRTQRLDLEGETMRLFAEKERLKSEVEAEKVNAIARLAKAESLVPSILIFFDSIFCFLLFCFLLFFCCFDSIRSHSYREERHVSRRCARCGTGCCSCFCSNISRLTDKTNPFIPEFLCCPNACIATHCARRSPRRIWRKRSADVCCRASRAEQAHARYRRNRIRFRPKDLYDRTFSRTRGPRACGC